MVRTLTSLLIVVVFGGCGKPDTVQIDRTFAPYVQRFQQVAADHKNPVIVDNLVLKFGPPASPSERGACEISSDKPPTIIINQAAWDSSTDAEKEQLVFHELGHCVLHRQHNSAVDNDGEPSSLMNPYKIDSPIYTAKQKEYYHELFAPGI